MMRATMSFEPPPETRRSNVPAASDRFAPLRSATGGGESGSTCCQMQKLTAQKLHSALSYRKCGSDEQLDRSFAADHGHALNLDQQSGPGKAADGDERASGKAFLE